MKIYYLKHSATDNTFYGVPEQKKFPLDSREHVISAIKFFNYVEPQYADELRRRIKTAAKKYGVKVEKPYNTDNRFYEG